ncbi:MAG: DUF1326 domain-containing protein [Verrucomicrobiales bacterium]|nr:DUF1326 domain-containing protein [Verrucomicrobiales bacterium]
MKTKLALIILAAAACTLSAKEITPTISGDYLEVRSCDVYTGPCVANAEMNLSGKEGILVWSVREGSWKGTRLDGLSIVAVVETDGTLGDLKYEPRKGRAVLIVDAKAGSAQQAALKDFARTMAGKLISEVADVKVASLDVTFGGCKGGSCATVKAGDLVEINTRCLTGRDHLCGNEENFYPPLTKVDDAYSAVTEVASFKGSGLNATWTLAGKRSAYLGTFAL